MGRHAIRCPDCGALLGTERDNGNIRPLVPTDPVADDAAWLLCPCGGRRYVTGVRLLLLSSRKSS